MESWSDSAFPQVKFFHRRPYRNGEATVRFPEEVLTRLKKGELEVRWLNDRGRYVGYNYLDPETSEPK